MTLSRSYIKNAVTTALDARLMLMAGVVCNSDGTPRAGVLGAANPSIVTALATMKVSIARAEFVTTKGRADGVAAFVNDGDIEVNIAAAPVSNSRIDVIWVKHNDNTTGDADSLPVFGVTAGAAAPSPVKSAIPTGALELATLRVYAGTTGANGGANTLTNTYAMTAARGGVVPFRTKVELDAWTPVIGQEAYTIDTGSSWVYDGSSWAVNMAGVVRIASGVIAAQSSIAIDGLTGYSEYEIVLDLPTASVANTLTARLRAAGAANASAVYDLQSVVGAGGAAAAADSLAATAWTLLGGSREDKFFRIRLSSLNATRRTIGTVDAVMSNAAAASYAGTAGLRHRNALPYDGLNLTTSGGTVTGTYTVYGIR